MATAYTTDSRFARHTLPNHPEHAGRLHAIAQAVTESGLLERLVWVEPRQAEQDDLLAVHSAAYLARLEATRGHSLVMLDADTYATGESYDTACLAAGAVLAITDVVLGGDATNGLAAVRPPGHHATPNRAMGFCLLNNVAVAARYAQRQHGVERVVIVDFDVHHGNGTQDAFYGTPSVLYISTHQSPLYPGTGAANEVGEGSGVGFTVNIPLPPGVGDAGYGAAFEHIVIPALRRFRPEVIFVSAGFDAHWADPLAQMALSLSGYDSIVRRLVEQAAELCQGRLVAVLEGGYHLDALAYGWANTIRAFLGDEGCDDPLGPARAAERDIDAVLRRIQAIHHLP